MTRQLDHCTWPGLLVSVRDAVEALAALAGGADVIDVKEPSRGSLGAADTPTIAAIVRAVNGRALITAAIGELADLPRNRGRARARDIPPGVSFLKIGLAGCGHKPDWPSLWRDTIVGMTHGQEATAARPVSVVYADWPTAEAPHPEEVLGLAIRSGCPALLIDTFDKSRGTLFDYWPPDELAKFVARVRSQAIAAVVAGSLCGKAIVTAARLQPNLIAVRGAACTGGRGGTVDSQRVKELRAAISAALLPDSCSAATEN